MRKVNLVACNFTHRWTDNENFSACGTGEPAAQVKEIIRGEARDFTSPDLAPRLSNEGKGKGKGGQAYRYICPQVLATLRNSFIMYKELVLMIV